MSGKACRLRPRVRIRCGEERFPRSKLPKLKPERATPALETCHAADDDTNSFGFSSKVLIHGWQGRRLQKEMYGARIFRDCARCEDLKPVGDWRPDIIIRRREHPATIFQDPLPANLDETRCLYATQLKSCYDEQYSDWAKRYIRERLYNPDGVDRGAEYLHGILAMTTAKKRLVSVTRAAKIDKEYVVTECRPQNYGLLEKKQEEWRRDIDITLGRRVADSSHHDEFPSAYRAAVRPPPPPPSPAACLLPRRRYHMADKKLPCGEQELCIVCEEPPPTDDTQVEEKEVPCVDALMAV